MRSTPSIVLALLTGFLAAGCSQHRAAYYCYDGGQIWVGDPNQKVWNGLGGVQMRFEIPRGADPSTWRPSREMVMEQLAIVDTNERVRWQLPSGYSRSDYYTNFVSLQEYERRTQEHR